MVFHGGTWFHKWVLQVIGWELKFGSVESANDTCAQLHNYNNMGQLTTLLTWVVTAALCPLVWLAFILSVPVWAVPSGEEYYNEYVDKIRE